MLELLRSHSRVSLSKREQQQHNFAKQGCERCGTDRLYHSIHLSASRCHENFERAFGLAWNESVQAYLVNNTQHTALKDQNLNVTFSLGVSMQSEPVIASQNIPPLCRI